jgi:hypothetical protein
MSVMQIEADPILTREEETSNDIVEPKAYYL